MIIKEMRIDRFNFDTSADYSEYNSFSIGHESCVIKFIHILRNSEFLEFLQVQFSHGKQIRLLTPFVPQSYLDEMKAVLSEILNTALFSKSTIIINDLGMLHYIYNLAPDRKLCLGRNMVFSFDFTPWGTLIYGNETQDIQKIMMQVNTWDSYKIAFYKRYHVDSIETNITENTFDSLSMLMAEGIDIYINESYFLYGTQRSCHIRRDHALHQCEYEKCDRCQKITLVSQWEDCTEFINEAAAYFPPFLRLRGNQICGPKRYTKQHPFNQIICE